MRKIHLFAGALFFISGMFSNQTFAATGCVTAACDPAVAAVSACGPAAACDSVGGACCDPAAAGCQGLSGAAWRNGCCNRGILGCMASKFEWSGYVDAGILCNTRGANSNSYTNSGSYNGGQFDAIYLSGVKKVNTNGCGMDWGAGVDVMFGENYRFMRVHNGLDQAWGTGTNRDGGYAYGFAVPQLYAQLGFNDWTLTAGHFYTPLGYEGAKGTDRFFYSRSLAFDALPVTHTGVTLSYEGFENLDVMFGWVNGIDEGFSSETGGSMVVGSFTYHINKSASLKYAFLAGNMADFYDTELNEPEYAYGSVHSVVLDINVTDKLDWVSELVYAGINSANAENTVLGQHLYYTVNDCWRWGMRIEWAKMNEYGVDNGSNEKISLTLGANWTPLCNKNFIVRPELRYDSIQFPGVGVDAMGFGDDFTKPDQLTLGFDLLYSF